MVALARRSHHVPLAARLLGHLVVHVTAEAPAHLVVQVLRRVFRQVAGALAPRDHGDHPVVARHRLGAEGAARTGDHEVAGRGGGTVGGEGESGQRQGGEVAAALLAVSVPSLEGTAGVEVFHGAVNRFIR